jgi:hypothetical protein
MAEEEKSFVAMLVQRLQDPPFAVRVQASVLLGDMGRRDRPCLRCRSCWPATAGTIADWPP